MARIQEIVQLKLCEIVPPVLQKLLVICTLRARSANVGISISLKALINRTFNAAGVGVPKWRLLQSSIELGSIAWAKVLDTIDLVNHTVREALLKGCLLTRPFFGIPRLEECTHAV